MKLIALMLAILCMSVGGRAEPAEADWFGSPEFRAFSDVVGDAGGFDVGAFAARALSGDLELNGAWLERAADALRGELRASILPIASVIAPLAALSMALRVLLGDKSRAMPGVQLFCRVGCAAALAQAFVGARDTAAGIMRTMAAVSEALAPLLSTAMVSLGAPAAGARMTPMAALCASLIERLLIERGLPLCACAAAVAIAGNLAARFRPDRLFSLLRYLMRAGAAGVTALYMGILTAQGLLLAGRDTAPSLAARDAVESLVPVIGGELSQALPTLARGALLARNALGVTGLAAIAAVCAAPLLRLMALMLSVKLSAALLDCGADPGMAAMTSRLGEVIEMLLAAALASAALAALLIGAALAMTA